jgi:hypothetical protein
MADSIAMLTLSTKSATVITVAERVTAAMPDAPPLATFDADVAARNTPSEAEAP